jgi:adenosine deaminase
VTVNSDDPAYFGGYVDENFHAVQEGLHLTRDDIYRLVRNSFRASFLERGEKQRRSDELDAYFASHP